MNRRDWLGVISILLTLLGIPAAGFWQGLRPVVTPPEHRFGLFEDHMVEANPIRSQAVAFQVVGADGDPVVQDNARRDVRLWDAVKAVEASWKPKGEHFDNVPQEIGDCVSFSVTNAINYLLAVQQAANQRHELRRAYPPYVYGASRVWIGKGKVGGGDGSIVAWAVQGIEDDTIGILAWDDPDVPQYAGSVAKLWGARGPPAKFKEVASTRVIKLASPVRSGKEARDAICNGYPVPFGAMFGSNTIKPKDGRMVARWDTRWAHAMVMVAYDGSLGAGKEYLYVLNSWGEDAHPKPMQGEPPGGFWITLADADRICRDGDAWAISNLDGFVARNVIDWDQLLNARVTRDTSKKGQAL